MQAPRCDTTKIQEAATASKDLLTLITRRNALIMNFWTCDSNTWWDPSAVSFDCCALQLCQPGNQGIKKTQLNIIITDNKPHYALFSLALYLPQCIILCKVRVVLKCIVYVVNIAISLQTESSEVCITETQHYKESLSIIVTDRKQFSTMDSTQL